MAERENVRRIDRLRRPFQVELELPGSKSLALRHVLISTLAKEPTRLSGVPRCDDVDAMFNAVARLGTQVERRPKQALLTPPAAPVVLDVELDLGMSGVSLRLLLAHAALRNARTWFTGHPQLQRRPNADLLAALQRIGCDVQSSGGGYLPIAVTGPASPQAETVLNTGVTSQYLTALLLVAPALPQGLAIHLEGERTSASYVGVTQAQMEVRGVRVDTSNHAAVVVPPGAYRGGDVAIEGDASAATYHAALATLHGGQVTFGNLGGDTTQGDYGFLELCERLGAQVIRGRGATTVQGPRAMSPLHHADMRDMPDAAPTLMALAPFLPAPTRIDGLATLRVKECDRIEAASTELRKAGVKVEEHADAMTIHPAEAPLRAAAFDTYEDHRMAMALSVFASRIGGCDILGADCVAKTYADYWQDFARFG